MNDFGLKIEKFIALFQGESADKYISSILLGLENTVKIAVIGLIIGIVIGTLIAAVRVMPKYKRLPRILNGVCSVYVSFFRGTPMVVQLLLAYYVVLPLLDKNPPSVSVAVAVFGLNSGAYISEIMRGGILSVDPGQMEGGRSVGLSFATTMRKIVIPQAVKNIIPMLGNEFITLIKETSVVSFIGATDLYVAFRNIGTSTYEFMVPYLAMAVIYIVMVLVITGLIKLVEGRMRRSDRGR
ncbi:MAG TPA: amino acid ABC transporter permease [Candidatus Fimenecus excrementigallinarum]|uniref:Amino acid ABC transporter permease n=1 Tax=Candidatus Fimenecus excrementigallinarum TaxID=2840816 RepID=A0A9D1IED0_9FIRM|nr:amino acid ABC transporter permease [Candidatus Fimenecus excrementigallinarum]